MAVRYPLLVDAAFQILIVIIRVRSILHAAARSATRIAMDTESLFGAADVPSRSMGWR